MLLEGDSRERLEEEEREEDEEFGEGDKGEISLHALKGVNNNKIIKVEGKVNDDDLLILIDSGSTHTFMDEGSTRRLRCPLKETQPLSVIVANGNRVISESVYPGFNWEMQGEKFEVDLRLLQLGGYDVVLGLIG